MNNRSYDLEIKKVSELPEIDNTEDFWIFGSKEDSEKRVTSVKYPLSKLEASVKKSQLEIEGYVKKSQLEMEEYVKDSQAKMEEAVRNLQLERRIALSMQTTEQIVPIGEDMTVYMAKASNVKKLEVKPNNVSITKWTEIPLNTDIEIILDKSKFEYVFRIIQSDPLIKTSSIYLLTKVQPI